MMSQIRTFIAIEIPLLIREKISEFQDELKRNQASIKWIKTDNIHITLKFLGNIDENRITDIAQAIDKVTEQIRPFSIEVAGAGVFPNYKKPRVIWVGAKSEEDVLKIVAKKIEQEMHNLGFEKEKRSFQAHLTMGRVKGWQGIDAVIKKLEEKHNFSGGIFVAKEIVLMRSDLKPTGAVYTPLKKFSID